MSYTNQIVNWQAHGTQDAYGDMQYSEAQSIKARKQPKQDIVKTSDGKELLSKSYFYVKPSAEANAFRIDVMDKLDGELIVSKYEMRTLRGKVKLIRFITV